MLSEGESYRAIQSRESRFDGLFFTAVRTTGIYCRPSCPAKTPHARNVTFYPTSAAAQSAGYRACKRCRPGAAPGSPEWNIRADVTGRAMRYIAEGVVDHEGVGGLARRLGYSERQVHRQLVHELGAGPIALARAQRCETARMLLEETDLLVSEIAFAAGFRSIRQFNETTRAIFAQTPSDIRRRRTGRDSPQSRSGVITLRLPFRPPFALDGLLAFLGARAVAGIEEGDASHYRRVLRLPHGLGRLEISRSNLCIEDSTIGIRLQIDDLRDLTAAVTRCRRLLDLDADPLAIVDALGADRCIGHLFRSAPGLRLPGHVDAEELAIRAVLGQQVSVVSARRLTGLLVTRYGEELAQPDGLLTHAFPTAASLAELDEIDLPMPRVRRATILLLARAISDGSIDLSPGADRDRVAQDLERVNGIGPWTSSYIRMRGLGDPDVFLESDLGVRRALEALGFRGDRASASRHARDWRPWRSYGLMHLWSVHQRREPPTRGERST